MKKLFKNCFTFLFILSCALVLVACGKTEAPTTTKAPAATTTKPATQAPATTTKAQSGEYGEWIEETPATCLLAGEKGHYEKDGRYYDANFQEITDLVIPKADHTYGTWVQEVAATCQATGTKGHYTCSVCGKNFDADHNPLDSLVIAVTDHTYGEWIAEVPSTCDEAGTLGHYHCSVCSKNFDTDHQEIASLVITPQHNLTFVAEVPATKEQEGCKAHYECSSCHKLFVAGSLVLQPEQEGFAEGLNVTNFGTSKVYLVLDGENMAVKLQPTQWYPKDAEFSKKVTSSLIAPGEYTLHFDVKAGANANVKAGHIAIALGGHTISDDKTNLALSKTDEYIHLSYDFTITAADLEGETPTFNVEKSYLTFWYWPENQLAGDNFVLIDNVEIKAKDGADNLDMVGGTFEEYRYLEVTAADLVIEKIKSDNLLTDASFEGTILRFYEDMGDDYTKTSYDNWVCYWWAGSNADGPIDGTKNGFLTYAFNGLQAGVFCTLYQDVKVEKNTDYVLTMFIKKWGSTPGITVQGRDMSGTDTWAGEVFSQYIELTADYKQYSVKFNSGNRDSVRIALFVQSIAFEDNAGGVFFDDFNLMEDPDKNILGDASFEDTILRYAEDMGDDYSNTSYDHWVCYWWAGSNGDGAIDGTKNGQLTYCFNGLPAGMFCTLYEDVKVSKNTDYVLTMYIKKWGTTPGVTVQGRDLNGDDAWAGEVFSQYFALTTEYQQFVVKFNSGNRDSIRIAIFVQSIAFDSEANNIGGVFFDNFSLKRNFNLLANPSFEVDGLSYVDDMGDTYTNKSYDNWVKFCWASTGADAPLDGAKNGALTYCWDGLPANLFNTLWQDVKLEKNTDYVFTIYVKKWGSTPNITIQGRNVAGAEPWAGEIFDQGFTLTDSYKKITIEFNSGNYEEVRLALWVCSIAFDSEANNIGGVFMDYASLVKK